jgi:hypothetical protein
MIGTKRISIVVLAFALARAIGLPAQATADTPPLVLAQAMVPPTGMMDAEHPMPMKERMLKRFPQPVRVDDLIGLPVLNENSSTLGHVRQVVRSPQGNIELIVSYSRFWGWLKSWASPAGNWYRSTWTRASTPTRPRGRQKTQSHCRTTRPSASHSPALSRSRLGEENNFLVFGGL